MYVDQPVSVAAIGRFDVHVHSVPRGCQDLPGTGRQRRGCRLLRSSDLGIRALAGRVSAGYRFVVTALTESVRMRITPTKEDLIELTSSWTGARFLDGRPRVPDEVLESLKLATTEECWSALGEAGFERQFAGQWQETHPGRILVGRAVTAQWLPHRPDYDAAIVSVGARDGYLEGERQNAWIIETLQNGDALVADTFGKIHEGSFIGDNLGTAIASRTGVGAVIHGAVRDLQGLVQLENVNIFFREAHPTAHRNVTLAGINIPIRIGDATVLPGDVVVGTPSGVIFVPPHLAESVAAASEDVRIRDVWAKAVLAERRYTSAEIDVATWAGHIEEEFQNWRRQHSEPLGEKK